MNAYLPPPGMPRPEAALRDAHSDRVEARWVAAMALGTVDGELRDAAVAALVELAADPADAVRAQALEGLLVQNLGGVSPHVGLFVEALDDPAATVRRAAIDALAESREAAPELILARLEDTHPDVRIAAAAAVGRLPRISGAGRLRALLQDSDPQVRETAAHALLRHGDHAGEPILLNTLSLRSKAAGDRSRQREAIVALGTTLSDPGRQALIDFIGRRGDPELRALAAAALCRSSTDVAACEFMQNLLHSRWARRAEAALGALHLLPCKHFLDDVVTLARSKKSRLAASAITVLGACSQEFPEVCSTIRPICDELKSQASPGIEDELAALDEALADTENHP